MFRHKDAEGQALPLHVMPGGLLLHSARNLLQGNGAKASLTHPDKASWKPGFLVLIPSPPPVFVGGFQNSNDVSSFEAQLLIIHSDMIPESFCVDNAAIAYQLRREESEVVVVVKD